MAADGRRPEDSGGYPAAASLDGLPAGPPLAPASSSAPPREHHPFKGRTVGIVNDLTVEEQWYLYQKVRELKQAVRAGEDLAPFRLKDPEAAVYLIFMEDSTRTKESFRNAAEFHGMKVNVFDAKTSSFQKNETITDTIKMLCGYSVGQSTFVIRSKIEGVCTWLDMAITPYTRVRGYPRASFINAGDGRHEHPSQELLDEFSFLEHLEWNRTSIHLALIGDLFHGRTVHSKVDGLKLYGVVTVDLVAPAELALPKYYEERMVDAGYSVRKFSSIEEYLAQPKVAKIWYFTRLQLERMGEKVLDKAAELQGAVTMQAAFIDKLPPGTKFFHPLPRDSRHPELPFWLDNTELNGWDQQSQNGYFTRIVLLGMLGGKFGGDFASVRRREDEAPTPGSPGLRPLQRRISEPDSPLLPGAAKKQAGGTLEDHGDFIHEVERDELALEVTSWEVGLAPLAQGVVIELLGEGLPVDQIWGLMYMVRDVLSLHEIGGQGVRFMTNEPRKNSGFISIPNFDVRGWGRPLLKKLAAMAPGSILKEISDGRVVKEFRFLPPPRIYNFRETQCRNAACISHPSSGQREVMSYFERVHQHESEEKAWRFQCKYCETPHIFWEIWDFKKYYRVGGE